MDKYINQLLRILNPHERTAEPTPGDRGYAVGEVKGVDKAKRQVTGVLSSPTIDRYGEIVLPRAFEPTLHQFKRNPKFLGAHAWGPETGQPTSIGRWIDIQITDQAVTGTAQFLDAGDELADAWWRRFEQGAVNTFSVGFIINKNGWEFRDVEVDGVMQRIRHFTSASLVEVSAVEIPANPDAALLSFGGAPTTEPGNRNAASNSAKVEGLEAIFDHIDKRIIKVLTDPVGPVDSLIREVVAAVQAGGSCGHHHAQAPPASGDDDLIRRLQALIDGA